MTEARTAEGGVDSPGQSLVGNDRIAVNQGAVNQGAGFVRQLLPDRRSLEEIVVETDPKSSAPKTAWAERRRALPYRL